MKFPSIIRLPDHKRFHIEPRYYDPIKEDVENRKALIKSDLEYEKRVKLEKKNGTYNRNSLMHRERISAAYQRNNIRQEKQSYLIKVVIVAVLLTIVFLFFGFPVTFFGD